MAKKLHIGRLPGTIDAEPKWFLKVGIQLEEMRIFYEAGVVLALYDALVLIRDGGLPTPDWVIDGTISILGPHFKKGIPTGKGASANSAAKYKNNMKDFRRWLVVRKLHQDENTGGLYKIAEKILSGKFAWGSAAVIGISFRKVQKHLKDPKAALQYYRGLAAGQKLMGTQYPAPFKVKPPL